MKSNNTISINGRLYDAKTGLPLQKSKDQISKTPVVHAKKTTPKKLHQKTVDGFAVSHKPINKRPVASKANPPKQTTTAISQSKPTPVDSAEPAVRKPHVTGSNLKRSVKHSVTLHRRSVIKPDLTQPDKHNTSVSSSAIKLSDNHRNSRINTVQRSSAISRFSRPKPSNASVLQAEHSEKKIATTETTKHAVHTPPAALSTKEQLIKKALGNASMNETHTQSAKIRKKPRLSLHKLHLARYASSALITLVLVGYVAYLNVPSLSMKVAAHRAGFEASLPHYKPAGYSLSGPIESSPGQVTVNFSSNTDNRKFSLKQQPTTWDSDALLENYVTKQSPQYRIWQDGGLTIYMYDGSSASWVNGGKMYHIEGKNSQLDADQLLKLAASV